MYTPEMLLCIYLQYGLASYPGLVEKKKIGFRYVKFYVLSSVQYIRNASQNWSGLTDFSCVHIENVGRRKYKATCVPMFCHTHTEC